jgi:hypothetical protein
MGEPTTDETAAGDSAPPHEGLSHRAIARACGVGVGTVSEYLRPGGAGGRGLAAAARARRGRARGAAVPPGRSGPGAPGAGPGVGPPGAQEGRGDPAAAVGGVPGGARRSRVRLQPVLRDLPALGAEARAFDAPGAPGRGEDVHRLLGPEAPPRGPAETGKRSRSSCSWPSSGRVTTPTRRRSRARSSTTGWAVHTRMAGVLRGLDDLWVPDQLKSAVTGPCRYEPDLNRTYQELARHYGAVVIPARPGKAKDKAKRRGGCAHRAAMDPGPAAQPHVLRAWRSSTTRSPACSRTSTRRKMQKIGVSRRELWEQARPPRAQGAARPSLRAGGVEDLPGQHRLPHRGRPAPYSVPYQLVGEKVEARFTSLDRRGLLQGPPGRCRTADATTASPRPWPSTCRARTGRTPSGRPRG